MSSWIRTSVALSLLLPLCAACHAPASAAAQPVDAPTAQKEAPVVSSHNYIRPSKAELKKTLNAIQFEVTQNDATEPPFRNAFWDNHQAGIYVDVATGEPLFSSLDKFESGTGWPSFTRPIEDGRVVSKSDGTLGMARIEVRSHAGDSHLGHVFDDGPAPTGERYCINSASLRFVPAPRLAAEGYGAYAARFKGRAVAPIAPSTNNACAVPPPGERPGCEATLDSVDLQGGPSAAAGLHDVTGVLEVDPEMGGKSVRVVFDPQRIAVAQLMDRWVSLGGERSAR